MKVDVIEIVGGAASFIECAHPAYETADQLRKARDAIAELIAADEQFNLASMDVGAAMFKSDDVKGEAFHRWLKANNRRAAALLACKGQDHER